MRHSIRLQNEASEAQQAELVRDRAKANAGIDNFRDLLGVLQEGRDSDIKAIEGFAANLKTQANRRHDEIAAWIKNRIAAEEAHLRDLDGNEPKADETAEEAANVEQLRNRKKA